MRGAFSWAVRRAADFPQEQRISCAGEDFLLLASGRSPSPFGVRDRDVRMIVIL